MYTVDKVDLHIDRYWNNIILVMPLDAKNIEYKFFPV